MGFRYVYYDANGNGPWAIETDTVEEAAQLVASGIGYDVHGEQYDQDVPPETFVVDLDTGDTVADGTAPDGVLLPGDAAYVAPEDQPAAAPDPSLQSADAADANSVSVQDPAVASHDVAGSPVTPTPTVPADAATDGSTPAYDATVADSGIVPSGPTPLPSDGSTPTDGGSSPDGSPSPQPASPASSPATGEDGPVVPGDTPVPPLGAPVTADAPADVATVDDSPTSDDNDVQDDAPDATETPATDAPDAHVETDTDDDLSSFDAPVVATPADDASTSPAAPTVVGDVAPTA